MTPRELFTKLQIQLKQNADTMTHDEVRMWKSQISQLQIDLGKIRRDLHLRYLAFLQFFAENPNELCIDVTYEREYNDEGGYYHNVVQSHVHGYHNASLNTFIAHWAYDKMTAFENPSTIYFRDTNKDLVATLKHPLLQLFDGYIPKRPVEWKTIWRLLRSTRQVTFKEGCRLLVQELEFDETLCHTLVSNYESVIHTNQLDFYCDGWWMILYVDDAHDISRGSFGTSGLLGQILSSESIQLWSFSKSDRAYTPPNEIRKPIMSLVYQWIHKAMTLHDYLTEDLIEEAKPYIDLTDTQ